MYYSSISHLFVLGTGLLSATIVTAQQQNTTQPANAPSNPQVQLTSPNDFCLFLPPQPGLEVAINEDNGIPFCLNPSTVQGAQAFPQGFITTAHYYQSDAYTQVTGFFDRTKYNLSITDEGGQYDSHAHHKPTGASCQNFPYFVSLIEPSNNRFCIRCCQDTEDCKTGISQRGCARVISPGNYDDNNQFDSVPPPPPPQASSSAGPTASSSAPPPPPSDSASGSGSAASSSPAPSDGSGQPPPANSSPSPSPAAGQTGAPTTNGTVTGGDNDDDSTTSGDSTSSTGDNETSEKQIPNTSYSSVSNDLDNSSFSDGNDIKTVDEEAKYIQSQLANPQVDLDALKTQFSTFTDHLSTTFPEAATKLKKLAAITSNYQTADQWTHLATILQQKAPGTVATAAGDEN